VPIQTYCHGSDAVYEVKRAARHHKVMRNEQVEAVVSGVPENGQLSEGDWRGIQRQK